MSLSEEIFATTCFDRDGSDRLAAMMAGAPPFVVDCFWAMVRIGPYSLDEMLARVSALSQLARAA